MQVPSAVLGARIGQRAAAAVAARGRQLLLSTGRRRLSPSTLILPPALRLGPSRSSQGEAVAGESLGGVRLWLFSGGSDKASRTLRASAPRVIASTVTTEEKEKGSSGGGAGMAAPQTPPPQPPAKLYAPFEAYRTGMLKVSPVHTVYFEESGNPKGQVSAYHYLTEARCHFQLLHRALNTEALLICRPWYAEAIANKRACDPAVISSRPSNLLQNAAILTAATLQPEMIIPSCGW